MPKYTEYELDYLQNNYPNIGCKACSQHLNREYWSLKRKALSMGLRVSEQAIDIIRHSKFRSVEKLSVNPQHFIDIKTSHHAYLLGFIWGDGYIHKKGHKIIINICESDGITLEETILKTGNWHRNIYYTKIETHQNAMRFSISNKRLYNFLYELGYDVKSYISHQKILEYIPDNYKHLWLRGLIDADGSFYYGKNKGFCIASTYEQDWDYLLSFFNKLQIFPKVRRRIHLFGKNSEFCFSRYLFFKILSNYIYPNGWDDIGLKRKFNRCQEIISIYA